MRTKDEILQYQKDYYVKNREKCLNRNRDYKNGYKNPKPVINKLKNSKKERLFQEKITQLWNLFGYYIEPSLEEIEKEILIEENEDLEDIELVEIEVELDEEDF